MGKRIIFVDDEPDILTISTFRLKKAGYEILTAVNGPEGIDLIRREKPDLVFLDLRLPEFGGDEICRRMKADPELKSIPVVLFTASVGHLTETVKAVSADAFLTKPFEPEQLFEKIRSLIG